MDNSQLLQAIKEHLDLRVDEVKADVAELKSDMKAAVKKQNNQEIRIVKLEGMAGSIKVAVVTILGAIGSVIAYFTYKFIDFWIEKQ